MQIIAVAGQTATGKTNLALDLALINNGELVNFDARQAYRELDIITGKDFTARNFRKTASLNGFDIGYYTFDHKGHPVKVWLYDIAGVKAYFSSFDYTTCAMEVVAKLLAEGKTPVLTGGTYLYLYHLLYEVDTLGIPPDFKKRKELGGKPLEYLQKELAAADPNVWENLNESERCNPQRLIRKIEIASHYRKSGQSTPLRMEHRLKAFFRDKKLDIHGLAFRQREEVRGRITTRVDRRLEAGAVDEVQGLLDRGYTGNEPGLQTIGYAQLIRHLKGEVSLEEARDEWITREVQYTKRQLTFMKKDPNMIWEYV